MKDIKTTIYSTITNDATFKTLTGATVDDKRLYQHYPQEEIDQSSPWVTYSTITSSPALDTGDIQDPDIVFIFNIWGLDADAVEDVFDRIQVLLDRKEFNPTSHRILFTRLDSFNDLVEIQEDLTTIYHKNTRYLMVGVFQT